MWSPLRRARSWRVLALSLAVSSPLAAQQSSRTLPLSIPTDWRLTCHAVTDSLGSGYEFSFGQPIDTVTRRLEARFDSSGRPLRLAETLLIDVPQDSVWSYSTGARFISRDSVVGVRKVSTR